ncbi:MAG: matrixin family metalloprotease [Pseudohongiellaceae bacterium]
MQRLQKILFTLALLTAGSAQISAFEINGGKWPTGEIEFYVDMEGAAGTGITWNAAFIAAMNEWNDKTPFNFILREENRDPCLNDGINSVDFSEEFCGSAFNESTLAVTVRRFESAILGEPPLTQADVIINQTREFNVYDGVLIQFPIKGLDLRRVALHELGHVIGLEHESTENAIMAPNIGNLDRLQADDIAGAEELYDGVIDCAVSDLSFGSTSNALDANDCTVSKLLPGSKDSSAIDVYQFTLTNAGLLELSMTSSTLDSVLLIADENLQVIGFDNKPDNQCSSALSQFLRPGSYFLLANTFDVAVKPQCGNSGDYQLEARLSSSGINPLGSSASLSGTAVNAIFSGGITANNGVTFRNQFIPTQSLDISARIDIDAKHIGQAGFLVVAAVVGEQVLLLNEQGQFVDAATNPGVIVRAANKTLAAVETLTVVENLVPASLGINEVAVGFYFGYGLSNKPAELFYHQAPLNLIVAP